MKQMPQIQKYMTALPHTIGEDILITTAKSVMREYKIRHLPVQMGGKLIGVLTDRDIKLASAFAETHGLRVAEVMTPAPYTVSPDAPLDQVVSEMAENKYGCAIIQQANGKVVGIFTAVDGLRILAGTLNTFYKPTPKKL